MLKSIVLGILLVMFSQYTYSQQSDALKKQFLNDIQSEEVTVGCKIVVQVLNTSITTACIIPEPTVSKVACAMSKVINLYTVSEFQPDIPNPIFDSSEKICVLTYATTRAMTTYTIEFYKNQVHEIKKTSDWLASYEGAVTFIEYMLSK